MHRPLLPSDLPARNSGPVDSIGGIAQVGHAVSPQIVLIILETCEPRANAVDAALGIHFQQKTPILTKFVDLKSEGTFMHGHEGELLRCVTTKLGHVVCTIINSRRVCRRCVWTPACPRLRREEAGEAQHGGSGLHLSAVGCGSCHAEAGPPASQPSCRSGMALARPRTKLRRPRRWHHGDAFHGSQRTQVELTTIKDR